MCLLMHAIALKPLNWFHINYLSMVILRYNSTDTNDSKRSIPLETDLRHS